VRKESYVQFNKNLMNYPLARDPHLRAKWKHDRKQKVWWCELPGQPHVRLRLPKNTDKAALRLPSGFDMNVLCLFLMTAHSRGFDTVKFASRTEVLKRLEVSVSTANRVKLDAAIELWRALSIRHLNWYVTKDVRERRLLPPPIVDYQRDEEGLAVELHPTWLHLQKGYLAKVPMPLPVEGAEQNMILKAAAWRVSDS
jgi:hypothetical protein